MDVQMNYERRNFYLRIITIIILCFIAASILFFKFGYVDPDDSGIMDNIGRNVTCKQAMLYYAEHEWGYDLKKKGTINIPSVNFSNVDVE